MIQKLRGVVILKTQLDTALSNLFFLSFFLFFSFSFLLFFLLFFEMRKTSTTVGGYCLSSLIMENLHDGLHNFYIRIMIFLRYNAGILQQMQLLKCLFSQQREIGIVIPCSSYPEADIYIWLTKLFHRSTFPFFS